VRTRNLGRVDTAALVAGGIRPSGTALLLANCGRSGGNLDWLIGMAHSIRF